MARPDERNPVERLLDDKSEDMPDRRLTRRSTQYARSLEAYFKAGDPPRWMTRLVEIDHGIARETQRVERVYRALQEECGDDRAAAPARGAARPRGGGGGGRRPRGVGGARARARPPLRLRRDQRAHRAAQRVVSHRAPAAGRPAHARLRARRGQVLPPSRSRDGMGSRALPCVIVRTAGKKRSRTYVPDRVMLAVRVADEDPDLFEGVDDAAVAASVAEARWLETGDWRPERERLETRGHYG